MVSIPPDFWDKVMAPPTPETIARLNTEVHAWELKVGMTTEQVRDGLRAGTVRETWEICELLMKASLRDDLVAATDPS